VFDSMSCTSLLSARTHERLTQTGDEQYGPRSQKCAAFPLSRGFFVRPGCAQMNVADRSGFA
jgi:hypothetical protein